MNLHAEKKKSLPVILYLLVAVTALFTPYFTGTLETATMVAVYVCCVLLFFAVTLYVYFQDQVLFTSILFFLLLFSFHPFMRCQERILDINFTGITHVAPILVYFISVFCFKRLKRTVTWIRCGKLETGTVALMVTMTILSAAGLLVWVYFMKPDLGSVIDTVPSWKVPLLVLGGIGFSISNAFVEEFIFRGVLWDGLKRSFSAPLVTVLVQAAVFGGWHFRGVPGGAVGSSMVFIWGIFLGLIRQRSKGMLAPIIGHFFADLTIFFILFVLSRW